MTPLQLVPGRRYVDRIGGVWVCDHEAMLDESGYWCTSDEDGLRGLFQDNGRYLDDSQEHNYDLIAEVP